MRKLQIEVKLKETLIKYKIMKYLFVYKVESNSKKIRMLGIKVQFIITVAENNNKSIF